MKPVALLTVSLALACGGEPGLPLGVTIQGLSASEIGAVQVSVLANGSSYLCANLAKTCMRSQFQRADGSLDPSLVKLRDAGGNEVPALRFPVDGAALLSGAGQTFEVRLPTGINYMVVAEILSKGDRLLGSGCGVVAQVAKGDNPALVVHSAPIVPAPTCDPLF